jgi:hypothetical protein
VDAANSAEGGSLHACWNGVRVSPDVANRALPGSMVARLRFAELTNGEPDPRPLISRRAAMRGRAPRLPGPPVVLPGRR